MKNDRIILQALADKRIKVDAKKGQVYNFFGDPIGHLAGRYIRVTIRYNGKDYTVAAHRIIWMAVFGEIIPEDLHVDHINGNKQDNRIFNLQLLTEKENIRKCWKERKEKQFIERKKRKYRYIKKAEQSRPKQDSAK